MNARLVFIHALSPLHAGTGQGIGVIDLPIAREKATGIPFLPGSSLKGSLRDLCQDKDKQTKIFGPEKNAEEHSGAAQFSDQRLLLLPVRSLMGTFAWVTCPYVLQRLARDAKAIGITHPFPSTPKPTSTNCLISNASYLKESKSGKVFLEDLDLNSTTDANAEKWADWLANQLFSEADEQVSMKNRFCVVSDDVFSFLLETATEVSARISLDDETKTVVKGSLWYEETLPTETVLSGLILSNPPLKFSNSKSSEANLTHEKVFETIKNLTQRAIQLGGKATVGHGLCSVKLVTPSK